MNNIKLLALAGILLLCANTTQAQENPKGALSVDLLSAYLWRGTDKGSICVQPTGEVKWHDATARITGSVGARREDVKEIDISLGYKWREFNVGLTDYWQSGLDSDGRDLYFNYDPHRSGHRFEVNLGYTHKYFAVQAYTMVYGNDFKYNNLAEVNAMTGKRAFSTYIELSAPFSWAELEWDARLGITPFAGANTLKKVGEREGFPLVQKDYFYANGFTCVLASLRITKKINMANLSLPIFAELHANPYLKKANFLVGLRIAPF